MGTVERILSTSGRGCGVDQNSLFELVAEYGDVYGTALPRDSSLLKTVDAAQNWLALSDALGSDRARQLAGNEGDPKPSEMQALIRWQADRALAVADIGVTPVIWLCALNDTGEVIAVESWDDRLDVELKFRLVGKYKSKSSAIDYLEQHYIFDAGDL